MSHFGRILCWFILLINCFSAPALATVSFSGDTQIGSQFIIGNTSYGTFRIDGGSIYTTPTPSSVVLGQQPTGFGVATVTGAGSQWAFTNSNGITVGGAGIGRLEVLNGGAITFGQSFGGIDIGGGSSPFFQGTVVVDGAGSLISAGSLDVGFNFSSPSSALLRVANGGFVTVGQLSVSVGSRVELVDGVLRTGQFQTNNGEVSGSGEFALTSTSSVTNAGRLQRGRRNATSYGHERHDSEYGGHFGRRNCAGVQSNDYQQYIRTECSRNNASKRHPAGWIGWYWRTSADQFRRARCHRRHERFLWAYNEYRKWSDCSYEQQCDGVSR